eukprot:274873_1
MYGNYRLSAHSETEESNTHNQSHHIRNPYNYNNGNMYARAQSSYSNNTHPVYPRGRGRGRGRRGLRGRNRGQRGGRRVMRMNHHLQLVSNHHLPPKQTGRSLTKQDKLAFRDIGCVVIKNGVAPDIIEKTLRKINYSIGKGIHLETLAPHTQQPAFNNEFLKSPEMMNLFTQSNAYSLCQDLFGVQDGVIIKNNRCHAALRYPEHPDSIPMNKSEYKEDEHNWHIDGIQNKNLPQFNVLCGIALSKQQIPFCGQFTIWPGTHYEMQRILMQYGYDVWWEKNHKPKGRRIWKDIEYSQCNVDIGDIILCHPLLCHKGGTNYSMNTRYNIYYRIERK